MRSAKLALVALSLAASVLAFAEVAPAQDGPDADSEAPAASQDRRDAQDGSGQPDDESSSRPAAAPAMQLLSKSNYPRKPGNGLAIVNSHPVKAAVPPLPGGLSTEAGAVTRSVSLSGQFAVFTTSATDLVAAPDRNPGTDVYVWDSVADIVKLITTDSSGVQRSGFSGGAEISPSGSQVLFWSTSEDLAPNQTITGNTSLFVKDPWGLFGATTLASVDNNGNELDGRVVHGSIANGGVVAFQSDSDQVAAFDNNQTDDIFVRDTIAGTTTLITTSHTSSTTVGNRASTTPSLSANGDWVVFASRASNLIAGDTNSRQDIFVHEIATGVTERVSVAPTGSGNANHHSFTPTISSDGRFVSFSSLASNLVTGDNNGKRDIFVYDRVAQSTERVTIDMNGNNPDEASYRPTISHDGSTVVFTSASPDFVPGDTNNYEDVFVWDRATKLIERVQGALEPDSVEYAGSPSGDGSRIIFDSGSHTLIPGQWSVGRHVYSFDR